MLILAEQDNEQDVRVEHDIVVILQRRRKDGLNEFSLYFDGAEFPFLGIFLNQDVAYLWYAKSDDHPGFNSVSPDDFDSANGVTPFLLRDQLSTINNRHVIPFELALRAAIEYWQTQRMPKCVRWEELP